MKCLECDLDFPDHLIAELAEGRNSKLYRRKMCPICANRILNNQFGLPLGTPFYGPKAQAMLEEAEQFLIKGEGK